MVRVSPDSQTLWLQTQRGNTNDVLEVATLRTLATEPVGKEPVVNAWTPDRRYSYVSHYADEFVSVFDAATFKEVGRIHIGANHGNITFRPDGKLVYVSVIGANKVAVIDTETRQVVKHIPAGKRPWGLIIWPIQK